MAREVTKTKVYLKKRKSLEQLSREGGHVKETGRFDMNSSSEIAQKFRSLPVKFAIEQEKQFR